MSETLDLVNPARRVVFLCTGNCIRSQMAEGLLRHLAPNRYQTESGGSFPAGFVHELAVRALKEIGVDIARHTSKPIEHLLPPRGEAPDVLVCLCENAAAHCPDFPRSVRWLYWPVEDPIHSTGTLERRLVSFRSARDQIRGRIEEALATRELDA